MTKKKAQFIQKIQFSDHSFIKNFEANKLDHFKNSHNSNKLTLETIGCFVINKISYSRKKI